MPALVAHFHFGQRVLPHLDDELRNLIRGNGALFGLGLQGPDLLFHYNAFQKNEITDLGTDIHRKSAEVFFGDFFRCDYKKSSKALAYMLGSCCHYSLDAYAHPFIDEANDDSDYHHSRIESDFDRFIIEKFDLPMTASCYLPRKVDCDVVSKIYGISPSQVRRCLACFRVNSDLLNNINLVHFVENILNKPGKWSAFSIKRDTEFFDEVQALYTILDSRIEPTARLLNELYNATLDGLDLPNGFDKNYNGK